MSEIDNISKLGQVTAQFMDDLDEVYSAESGYKVEIGEVVISAEVYFESEDGQEGIDVATSSSTDNIVHQTGILDWAHTKVTEQRLDEDYEEE